MKNKILKFLSEAKNVVFASFVALLAIIIFAGLLSLHWLIVAISTLVWIVVDFKAEEIAEACQYSLSIDDE